MKKWTHTLFCLLFLGIHALQAQDWPRWRGPGGNGKTAAARWNPGALNASPKLRWSVDIGAGYGSVIVVGSSIYAHGSVDSTTDVVRCLSVDDGSVQWEYAYTCPVPNGCFTCYKGPRATPAYSDHRLYTLSHQGQLFCLHAETGKLLWKKHLTKDFKATRPKYGFSGSPVIEGESLILNARESGLVLHKESGRKVWASPEGKASFSTPVIYEYRGRKAVMLFAREQLVSRDLRSGKKYWQHPWPYVNNDGAAEVDPVIVGQRVFISSGYRKGGAVIDFSSGQPATLWFDREIRTEFGTALYNNGLLFAPHGDTRRTTAFLKCVDFNTGKVLWTRDTGHCAVIQINDRLMVLNQWGRLTVMQADSTGCRDDFSFQAVETSRKNRCWTAPVFARHCAFIRRSDGRLVCIDFDNTSLKTVHQ